MFLSRFICSSYEEGISLAFFALTLITGDSDMPLSIMWGQLHLCERHTVLRSGQMGIARNWEHRRSGSCMWMSFSAETCKNMRKCIVSIRPRHLEILGFFSANLCNEKLERSKQKGWQSLQCVPKYWARFLRIFVSSTMSHNTTSPIAGSKNILLYLSHLPDPWDRLLATSA